MAEVTIYTKPGCPHCAAAKASFEKKDVEYEEISVPSTKGALGELMKLTGGKRRVPTIVQGGEVTIGFNGGS